MPLWLNYCISNADRPFAVEECRGKDEERVSEFSIRADNYESGNRRLRSPPLRGKDAKKSRETKYSFDSADDEDSTVTTETDSIEESSNVIRLDKKSGKKSAVTEPS
jgi:hypothetical protein